MRDFPGAPPAPPDDPAVVPAETRRVRGWQRLLARARRASARVEYAADSTHAGLRRRFGRAGKLSIIAYRGFGNPDGVTVLGRLVEARSASLPSPEDTTWQNIMRVVRSFNTREVPEAEIEVTYAGACTRVTTDEEGYFRAVVRAAPDDREVWQHAELDLVDCPLPGWNPLTSRAEVMVPGPQAALGIISDIDDTVLQTHVTERLRMLWVTFSRNAHTRLPFPGTSDLYRALVVGPAGDQRNPVFYVSKSPWNLYEFLVTFLDKHQLPRGPLFLRDVGLTAEAPLDFKSACIDEILATYPRLPFVLIGDSGERDPDIYVETAARHPGRVRAIYIRDVGSSPARRRQLAVLAAQARRLGAELLYVTHAHEALGHARRRGLIAAAAGGPGAEPVLGV